jgi:hypothetical protein
MSNFDMDQSQATEQALREQNHLLRKQLEDMNAQMLAFMAQIQGNIIAQSSQASQEALPNMEMANAEAVVLVETAQRKNEWAADYKAPHKGNYQSRNYQPVDHPRPNPTPEVLNQAPQRQQARVQRRNNPPILRYPPLPVSQTEIYRQLVAKGLIRPMPAHPRVPPYPAWYNPKTRCAYHGNVPGHYTEDCVRLRQRIYELINAGSIKLNLVENKALKIDEQSKINNAASNESIDDQELEKICWPREQRHEKQASPPVTVLKQCQLQKRQAIQLPPLPVSHEDIYKQLVAEGLLSPIPTRPWKPPYPAWYDPNVKCVYHSDMASHSTENCINLRQKINELIGTGTIKLNPVGQGYLEINDQPWINEITSEEGMNIIKGGEDDQEAEEICWPGKQGKNMHVGGDGPASSNIWKIPQGEEGPRSYNVTL